MCSSELRVSARNCSPHTAKPATYCREDFMLLLHFIVKHGGAVRVEFVGAQIPIQRLELRVGRQSVRVDWREHHVLLFIML